MPARHPDVGRLGEDAAAALLAEKGLRILARNLRLGRLEIDILAEDGEALVFAEVKTRGEGSLATPAEGLTRRKASCLVRAARLYLSRTGQWSRPCRFDLVAVRVRRGCVVSVEHVENVIAESDSGTGEAWQPW